MTGMKSNIDDVISRFKSQIQGAKNLDFSQALVVGINAAKGQMQFRIFNKGLDSNNKTLGTYKRYSKVRPTKTAGPFTFSGFDKLSPYEKERTSKGRQIVYKDLEFTGDLRRGIIVLKQTNTKVVCAIPNQQLFLIAQGQENYLKTFIFRLSKEERETLIINVNAALKQLYDSTVNASGTV